MFTERSKRRKNWYLQGNREQRSGATLNEVDTVESNFNKLIERCVDVCITG